MKLTEHCKKRIQQRGIHPDTIYLIREHGRKINTHGDFKMFLDKKALKSLLNCRDTGNNVKRLERQLKTTAIVITGCGSQCITAMKIHESKRLNWKNVRWN